MAFRMKWRSKFGGEIALSLVVIIGLIPQFVPNLMASENLYSINNFGGIGLLDMRTARFAPDGTIAVGVHYNSNETRYFSTWQATPWLETTLSYTDDTSDISGMNNLGVDRSLDVKIRLWTEGNYRPQLAVGIQDALGTGRFDAEYLVASKRYYDFDFTMGFAWGYLGSRGGIGNIFGDERSITTSSGGIRSGSYFSGSEMSFFAGAEYRTFIKDLSFKIEYSGVDTTKLEGFSHLKRETAFNFGMNYKPTSWVDLAVGFDHGDRFGVRLTLKQNLHKLKFRKWLSGTEPAPLIERRKSEVSKNVLPIISSSLISNDRVFDRLRHLGVKVIGIEQKQGTTVFRVQTQGKAGTNHMVLLGALLESSDRVTLYIHNSSQGKAQKYDAAKVDMIGKSAIEKFRNTAVYLREKTTNDIDSVTKLRTAQSAYENMSDVKLSPISIVLDKQTVTVKKETGPFFSEVKNIGRTARILTREMPDNVEEFVIISEKNGAEISQVSLLRQDLEKANNYQSSPEEIWINSEIVTPTLDPTPDPDIYQPQSGLQFDWGFKPHLLTHFGGNEDGRFRADLYANLFGSVQLSRQLKLSAELKQYIVGDIDKIPQNLRPDIPKARSDISRYASEGRTAIERVQLDYTTQIDRNIYARLTGGLLESMYGGIGAELLYHPYENNFAFGVDVNWVKQRDFDQLFSFRDYDVLTGHATFYLENTTYNITSKLSAGRYLAGDYGATFDVSRRFSNGIRIGVWATVTDMSSEEFGDGSFDKGIYLTMPLEIFWVKPTQEKMRYNFRSLGKNGGQKMDRGYDLYDILSSGRKNRLANDWYELLD